MNRKEDRHSLYPVLPPFRWHFSQNIWCFYTMGNLCFCYWERKALRIPDPWGTMYSGRWLHVFLCWVLHHMTASAWTSWWHSEVSPFSFLQLKTGYSPARGTVDLCQASSLVFWGTAKLSEWLNTLDRDEFHLGRERLSQGIVCIRLACRSVCVSSLD